jgi:hypothetical protein
VLRKKLSRNTPCPWGSGKKYKHCCYGKGIEDDLSQGSGRQQPQYPIGTVAMYGPDDKTTTKIAAGVILHESVPTAPRKAMFTHSRADRKRLQRLHDNPLPARLAVSPWRCQTDVSEGPRPSRVARAIP